MYFERALDNEPQDAQAHAGLAQTLTTLALIGEGGESALDTAVTHAQQALELDRDNAEAYAIAATLAFVRDRDDARADKLFRRATELAPESSAVRRPYARFLSAQSRHAEAVEKASAAFAGDPLSANAERDLVGALFTARRYDEALTQARHLLERHPDAVDMRLGMTYIYLLQGEAAQAYAAFVSGLQHMGVQSAVVAKVREAFEEGGMQQVLVRWLEMLEREAMLGRRVSRDVIALHALLGHNDTCFELLEGAVARREPFVLWLASSPLLDSLRDDSRFSQLFPNG